MALIPLTAFRLEIIHILKKIIIKKILHLLWPFGSFGSRWGGGGRLCSVNPAQGSRRGRAPAAPSARGRPTPPRPQDGQGALPHRDRP